MIPLKDEKRSNTHPAVTVVLVALNAFVFGYLALTGTAAGDAVVYRFSMVPARLLGIGGGAWLKASYTPVSALFLHGGLLQLSGNMLFLWVFGERVEERLGHLGFLAFYLACGVAAAVVLAVVEHGSTLPMLGASAAVSGVLGAYILMYPRAGVWTYFFPVVYWRIIKVPAVILIGVWILLQFISGVTGFGRQTGGVAWFADIGGFFAGVALAWMFALRNKGAGRRTGRASWRTI